MVPEVGAVMRAMSLSKVDLPAPLWPMRPRLSPWLIFKSISLSARKRAFFSFTSGALSLRLGSSLPRLRAHQLCRSRVRVPPPIMPSRYSLDTWSIHMAVFDMGTPPYTVSIKFFSILLNSKMPTTSTTSVVKTLMK